MAEAQKKPKFSFHSAEEFLSRTDLTVDIVDELTKDQLCAVAQVLGVKVFIGAKKSYLNRTVCHALVSNGLIESDGSVTQFADPKEQAELLKLQLQLKDKEIELREKEMAHEFKLKELGMKESKVQSSNSTKVAHSGFDFGKNIRLVPKFDSKEVTRYFTSFEDLAKKLEWPKKYWTTLLHTVFEGKAKEVYTALSSEQSGDYDVVKQTVLKAYELVPEAYRQKFRKMRRRNNDGQTYVEFAREKANAFDRWLKSKEIDKRFDNMRELILMEEFKSCLPNDIKTHLADRDVNKLEKAARMADDYELTHKQSFGSDNRHDTSRSKSTKGSKNSERSGDKSVQSSDSKTESDPTKGKENPTGVSEKPHWRKNRPVCSFCGKIGHTFERCFKRRDQLEKPIAFIASESCGEVVLPKHNVEKNHIVEIPLKVATGEESQVTKPMNNGYEAFMSHGRVSVNGGVDSHKVKILRDTGAAQSLLLKGVVPSLSESSQTSVLIRGVEGGFLKIPLKTIHLESDFMTGPVSVGIVPSLPIECVTFLLGNDIAGANVQCNPCAQVTEVPHSSVDTERLSDEFPGIFPACVTTRSMVRASQNEDTSEILRANDDECFKLAGTFFQTLNDKVSREERNPNPNLSVPLVLNKNALIKAQECDPELRKVASDALSLQEAEKVPVCYFWSNSGVLMRKWRSPEVPADQEWRVLTQIVVPKPFRAEILKLAHEPPTSGHLGVRKTQDRILCHFFWPKLYQDVGDFCRTCHTCQVVGKPNQKIQVAPLIPIPACGQPFDRVIIDCVGPLPKTRSGHMYLLTIMDACTRYPEAIPLRNITAKSVSDALVKFFTRMGLPKEIQHDQGSNFMSRVFGEVMQALGIEQMVSSAYHPQSQGALERYHQTLKTMLKTFCHDNQEDWDKGIDFLLFATRDSQNESTGFSPFELVYGHEVRGPLKLVKERWLAEPQVETNLLEYVCYFKDRLYKAYDMAKSNLSNSQERMKSWYDKNARERSFQVGEKVLILLPIQGEPLRAKFSGPYIIERKLNSVNYVVKTPDRRKTRRVCHVNMLKKYHERISETKPVVVTCSSIEISENKVVDNNENDEDVRFASVTSSLMNQNSDVLMNLDCKLCHLPELEHNEMVEILESYVQIFQDKPGRTSMLFHDVDVGNASPIKQHPYRLNPTKLEYVRKAVTYMLENDIISHANQSPWSSPVVLVPKEDGTQRPCIDYRKVNSVTKTDSYPIPRLDECIDRIGHAKYVSKYDLLKGYWQVPLTQRAREISAFVTPDGLFECNVMPFGMKNAPSTFTRMMNQITSDLDGCGAYIDDVIIYSDTWTDHVVRTKALFDKLSDANLTVNLKKSEIGQAHVTYLGHEVGQGKVSPKAAKVQAINDFKVPAHKKELMRFLGMTGFYRKFCSNFAHIAEPLTNLLAKNTKFVWTESCQAAFENLKGVLTLEPVLMAADFGKPFKLVIDASDVGVGAALLQDDDEGVEHPVIYFSKKLNKHQKNYSTIEKETLSLMLAISHFEVYVTGPFPVTVFTDHNPLTYLNKFKNKSQRLMRWSLLLQGYNLEFKHIPGKQNIIADGLSRS